MEHLTYLFLLLIYLVIPVILGFQKNVRFVFRLRYFVPAALFSALIFLMLEWRFISSSIWTFNGDYLTGLSLLKIPVEEWLSLFIIAFSSAYIYEWLKIRFKDFEKPNLFLAISLVLFVVYAVLAYVFRRNLFSFFTFFLTAIYLGYTVFRNRYKKHFTKFYLAWLITLLPFFIVSFISNLLPVVIYNAAHIIQVNVLGIPVERFVYLYLLLLINFTIYEFISDRKFLLFQK